MVKVWLDWDSGPYETASAEKPTFGTSVEAEISDEDFRDYEEVLRRYDEWQRRLERLRKRR